MDQLLPNKRRHFMLKKKKKKSVLNILSIPPYSSKKLYF